MAISYNKTNWVNGQSPAINATNLNNIENGINNATTEVNKCCQFTLLWQNASPSSEFSSQTISASLSSYSHCGVVIGGSGMKILKVRESGEALTSYGLSASNINGGLTKREYSTTTTGVSFQNAYCKTFDSPMSPFTNNSALVPRYIFGIKNVPTSV